MEKSMLHHEPLATPILAALLGLTLHYAGFLPSDLAVKILTLLATGIVTGVAGLLAQRITKNILKRIQKRRMLPSILKDEDES